MSRKSKEPAGLMESFEKDISVDDLDTEEMGLDEEVSLDDDSDDQSHEPKATKAKPKRRARTRKQPTLSMDSKPSAEVEAVKEPKPERKMKMVADEKPAPKTVLKTSETPVAVEMPLVVDATPTLEASVPAWDKAAEQPLNGEWGAVRDVSASVSENLSHVAKQLKDLQTNYQSAIQDAKKQTNIRPALVSKIAIAASAVAMVFSFISFSLSQSARSAVLNDNFRTSKSDFSALPPVATAAQLPKARAPKVRAPIAESKTPFGPPAPIALNSEKKLSKAQLREKALAALIKDRTGKTAFATSSKSKKIPALAKRETKSLKKAKP